MGKQERREAAEFDDQFDVVRRHDDDETAADGFELAVEADQ